MTASTIRHPEIAGVIREAMTKKGLANVSELNVLLGLRKSAPQTYNWVAGRNAPTPAYVRQLAKILGVEPSALTRRPDVRANGNGHAVERAPVHRPAEQLSFALLTDGQARLRLDITGPIERISPVLLHLMNEKLVPPSQFINDEATNE